MKRTYTSTPIGDHVTSRKRHRILVEDDPSGPSPADKQAALIKFLQALVDQPLLLQCGYAYPTSLGLAHNESAWVLVAEAVADEL